VLRPSQSLIVERIFALMIFAYGDESMDETEERVCAVAGVIGPEPIWKKIESEWADRTGGIEFHANDCDSDQGNYANPTNDNEIHKANKALYRDLTVMLATSGLLGFAAVTDLRVAKSFQPSGEMNYLREFSYVIDAMRHVAKNCDDMVEMCFDTRIQSNHNAGLMYANARTLEPEWQPYMGSRVSFESSDNPRIQVADLFAREAMKHMDNQVGPKQRPPRKSWIALRNTGNFHAAFLGESFFNEEKEMWKQIVETKGNRYPEYQAWLTRLRREHSLSNVIAFTGENPLLIDAPEAL